MRDITEMEWLEIVSQEVKITKENLKYYVDVDKLKKEMKENKNKFF